MAGVVVAAERLRFSLVVVHPDLWWQEVMPGHGPPADLLIAAAAEAASVPLLHYDHDYDLIAEVSRQVVRWILPAGSLP